MHSHSFFVNLTKLNFVVKVLIRISKGEKAVDSELFFDEFGKLIYRIDSSLKYHIEKAKKNGVSSNELCESLTHIAMYVGWPKIWAALRYVKEIYESN